MISRPKKSQNKIYLHERRLVSMAQAGEIIGCSYWLVRELWQKGVLPSVRVGRKRMVDVLDLEQFRQQNKGIPTVADN